MPQVLTRTPLFEGERTAVTPKNVTLTRINAGVSESIEVDPAIAPGSMRPDQRAVLNAASTSPKVKVDGGTSVEIVVHTLTGAPSPAWPANEAGRPMFAPRVQHSGDGGKNWRTVADFGPVNVGTEVRTVLLKPGHLRIVEAVGGVDASVVYGAAVIA